MNFKKIYSRIITVVFLITVLFNSGVTMAKGAEINEGNLKSNVVALKTVQARNGFEDLKPLEEILKNKKIIAVGEATHGTKEFFQMKHRMFEFLVEKMGFRLFGIEASFGECRAVNEYIVNGKGKAQDVVKGMGFWTWSTKEVVDMVEWMRTYNENPEHKTKIKFYGFDMQSSDVVKQDVLNYIKKIDNKSLKNYKDVFGQFNDKNIYSFKIVQLSIIKDKTQGLLKEFEKNKSKYISKSSRAEYEMIHQELNITNQCLHSGINDIRTLGVDAGIRDYYMAQNVKWILDYEKQFGNDKIMLWAHNGHVAKKFPSYVSMGENLKKIFNDDIYVIGQDFYKGSFRALPYSILPAQESRDVRLKEFNIKESPSYTFAHKLQSANMPLYFMDFKLSSKDKEIEKLLSEAQVIHEIGAVYSDIFQGMSLCLQVPKDAFDGIIFIRDTSASISIK